VFVRRYLYSTKIFNSRDIFYNYVGPSDLRYLAFVVIDRTTVSDTLPSGES